MRVVVLLLVILMSTISSEAQAKELFLTPTDHHENEPNMLLLDSATRNRNSIKLHFFRYSSSNVVSEDKRLVPMGSNPFHNSIQTNIKLSFLQGLRSPFPVLVFGPNDDDICSIFPEAAYNTIIGVLGVLQQLTILLFLLLFIMIIEKIKMIYWSSPSRSPETFMHIW